jgi:hypothetical protein
MHSFRRRTGFPSGQHALQERMQGRVVDGFRHKTRELGGLDARDRGRIRVCTHEDNGDRRRGLNVPRGVNAVHGPVQLDVHEHDLRVMGESVCNRLRAIVGRRHDRIPEAAELPGDLYCGNGFILDNEHAGRSVHRATFGSVRSPSGTLDAMSAHRHRGYRAVHDLLPHTNSNFYTLKDIYRVCPDLSCEYAEQGLPKSLVQESNIDHSERCLRRA